MYLNLYTPSLQTPSFVAHFIKTHLGMKFASSAVLAPISEAFVKSIKEFRTQREIDLVPRRTGLDALPRNWEKSRSVRSIGAGAVFYHIPFHAKNHHRVIAMPSRFCRLSSP